MTLPPQPQAMEQPQTDEEVASFLARYLLHDRSLPVYYGFLPQPYGWLQLVFYLRNRPFPASWLVAPSVEKVEAILDDLGIVGEERARIWELIRAYQALLAS